MNSQHSVKCIIRFAIVGIFSFTVLILLFQTQTTPPVEAFIFWKANTTACDICDGVDTYSGRNVACCFLFSKCCGYNSLDEAEILRANETAAAAAGRT